MGELENLDPLKEEFLGALKQARESLGALQDVEELRLAWLGKKGKMAQVFASLKNVPRDQKAARGQEANHLKKFIEEGVQDLAARAKEAYIERLCGGELDVTLPVAEEIKPAGLHPVTLMRRHLEEIFHSVGFVVCDGPELELDFYNFAALNIPDHHPARDMQDTFYLSCEGASSEDLVLRTQTSNIQIHTLKSHSPPVRIVAPGRVYRLDSDPTHTPLFHQIEGLVVDHDVSMGHLKGMVEYFLKQVFGSAIEIRFRPSYFPFVEPGAEVDIRHKGSEWLEVGGCGMVHPNVFETVGYDSEQYSGYAFGFGIDRLAMMAWGLGDLRQFFLGNRDFHSDFPLYWYL